MKRLLPLLCACILSRTAAVSHSSLLAQNYPDPFNPVTTLEYQVASLTPVTIKVFDLLGREVGALVNEVKPPGIYRLSWDAGNFSSGVYIVQMRAGTVLDMKRVILLR